MITRSFWKFIEQLQIYFSKITNTYLKITVNVNFIFIYDEIFVSSVLGKLIYHILTSHSQCSGEAVDTMKRT